MDEFIRKKAAINAINRNHRSHCNFNGVAYNFYSRAMEDVKGTPAERVVSKDVYDQVNREKCEAVSRLAEIEKEKAKTSNWINVDDRLPEEAGFYLVKVGADRNPIRVLEYRPDNFFSKDRCFWKASCGYVFNWFVTHWMPLPGFPKESEQ